MTNKENAIRTIKYDHPAWVMSAPPCRGIQYAGCNHECPITGKSHDEHAVGEQWYDIWGTGWVKEKQGVMAFPRMHPLAHPSALSAYTWPDANDERLYASIYQMARQLEPGDYFVCGQNRDTLWERAYMLIGMEDLMVYFYEEPAFVKEVLARIMDFQLGMAKHYVKAGIEMVALSDDLGTQNSLLLHPNIMREFLLPEYKRLCGFYKEHGVYINFHSCGHIEPALDMFMDLGVDILNPVQATANNLANVKRAVHGRMAVQGGISSGLVESGPIGRIEQDVREKLALFGREGGYFCCVDQHVPAPEAHREAITRTLAACGAC